MRYTFFVLLLLALPAFSAEPVYTWYTRTDDSDRVYLYRDGQQIGGWCYRAQHYRPYDGKTWGGPLAAAPVPPPVQSWAAPAPSWPSQPYRRGLRGRLDATLDQAMRNYINSPAFLSGFKLNLNLKLEGLSDFLKTELYVAEVCYSTRLFAHLEMGGKLDAQDEGGASYFMTKGSARIFLSERARFAEKLKEEEFSKPVLTKVHFEVQDDNPVGWDAFDMIHGLSRVPGEPADRFESRVVFNPANWRENPKSPAADIPTVLLSITRRNKDPKEKNPVAIRCSFVFASQKDSQAVEKTLGFDLYLETLEHVKGEDFSFGWKVRDVRYK